MEKFKFTHETDDGTVTSIDFKTERWMEAFPHMLNLMRAVGYSVGPEVALYAPNLLTSVKEDYDFIVDKSDFSTDTSESPIELHSKYYYDHDRNKS